VTVPVSPMAPDALVDAVRFSPDDSGLAPVRPVLDGTDEAASVLRNVFAVHTARELLALAEGVAEGRTGGSDGRSIVWEELGDRVILVDGGDNRVQVSAAALRRAFVRLIDAVLANTALDLGPDVRQALAAAGGSIAAAR
jgi:hypothetical protein